MTSGIGKSQTNNPLTTRKLMQQFNRNKKSPSPFRSVTNRDDDEVLSQQVSQLDRLRKNPRSISKSGLLQPVKSARISGPSSQKAQIQQAVELCKVVDKTSTGKIQISNFLRISQVCNLKIDNITLMKHTNERLNTVDYSALTRQLLQELDTSQGL